MAFHPTPLPELPWTQGPHPLERKKVCAAGHLVQLRFEPGFQDPAWCRRGHTLFVLSGVLHLEGEAETLALPAGSVCIVDADTPHRAANRGPDVVTLLALQHDVPPGPCP